MDFTALIEAAEPLEQGLRLAIPPSWHQGRTGYGGFSAAVALAAAQRVGGALPPLRSAQVSFVGPLYGEIEARAKVLRQGKNATWISAELTRATEQAPEVGLTASFVFMGPVESALHLNACAPPEALVPVDEARPVSRTAHAPAFIREHFEVRFAVPRPAEATPEVCWWVRPNAHAALDAMIAPLLCADAVPPGVLPLMQPGIMVSSMTWQVNMLTPTPATRDGWWLLRSVGTYAEAGCSSQQMQLWNADGEPILSAIQSVALFG
ncbi:MAG: thioesterase family protein [Novosphingobium sp.]